MKKLVLTSVCTLAVAGAAFAQGTVLWSGPNAACYTTQTNSTQYSPLFNGGATITTGFGAVGNTTTAAGSEFFELLYKAYTGSQAAQPTSLIQLAGWSDTGLGGQNNTAVAGRNSVSASNAAQVVPWANGTTDSVMLVEWSSNLGTNWANALATLQNPDLLANVVGNAFLDMSQTGYINPSTSTTAGAVLFNNSSTTAGLPIGHSLSTQLYLVPVPEPGTIAMAALGGLSLLAFRRKK